ncbi:hypothetical protein ACOME3_001279 [Neoechinorhynchus agilis]
MLFTISLCYLLTVVAGQTFDCTLYGGRNITIPQSSVCSCPSSTFHCDRQFPESCVPLTHLQQICSNIQQVGSENCFICAEAPQAGYFQFTQTNGVPMCIKKSLACLCPEGKITCPVFAENGAFSLCSPSAQLYSTLCGTINTNCGVNPGCGVRHTSPGCGSVDKGCQSCLRNDFFDNEYCFSCFSNTSNHCKDYQGVCVDYPDGYCGTCNSGLGYFNCPSTSPNRCVDPLEQCWRCTDINDPVLCSLVPSTAACSSNYLDCGLFQDTRECMPLNSACGNPPSNCKYTCKDNFALRCASEIDIAAQCISDIGAWVPRVSLGGFCPEDTFPCPNDITRCVPHAAVCGCLSGQTSCNTNQMRHCVANSAIQAACNAVTSPTTSTTKTTITTTTTTTTTTTGTRPLTMIDQSTPVMATTITLSILIALAAISSIVLAILAKRASGSRDEIIINSPPRDVVFVVDDT